MVVYLVPPVQVISIVPAEIGRPMAAVPERLMIDGGTGSDEPPPHPVASKVTENAVGARQRVTFNSTLFEW